jgi:FAD/FMN-containing dehydrogenase
MGSFTFPSAFKGDFVTANDADYSDSIVRWATNGQRKAKVVAFVKDAADVALALKFAKEQKLAVAIHGGGHNPGDASSVEGGLVIDLARYVNTCKVDAENKLAYIGGGATWAVVNVETMKHSLATVGGTVSHVSLHLRNPFYPMI